MSTALREVFASFGIDVTGGEKLQKLDNGVDKMIGNLKAFGAALLGSAVVQGVRAFAKGVQEAGDEINDTSTRLGIATDELQAFRYAAKLAADQGPAQLDASLQRLGLSIEAAGQGAKKQKKALKDLGVVGLDADKNMRPFGELLPELADGFAKMSTASERNAAAVALFGKQGVKLGVLLGEGREGLAKYREEFDKLGGGFGPDAVKAAAEYGDALDRMDAAAVSLRAVLGTALLPAMQWLTEKATTAVGAFTKFNKASSLLGTSLKALGGALLVFTGRLIAANIPMILAAVGVAVLVAALDELFGLFSTDHETLIESLVDEIWGMGTAAEYVTKTINSLTFAWENMKAMASGDYTEVEKLIEEHKKGGAGAARFGDEVSDTDKVKLKYGGRGPDAQAQDAAASEGSSDAFVKNRDRTTTKEAAFEQFKERRLALVNSGQVQASQDDVKTFGDRIKPQATIQGRGGENQKPGKVLSIGPTTISVTVPAGTNREQADHIVKTVNATIDARNRKAAAALAEEAE